MIGCLDLMTTVALAADPDPAGAQTTATTNPATTPATTVATPVVEAAYTVVSPLRALDPGAAGLASLLTEMVTAQLRADPRVWVVPLDQIPDVRELSAAQYLDACPPGQDVGCAFVVGEGAHARIAVAGTAETDGMDTSTSITVLNVETAEEVLSFSFKVGASDREAFATRTAALILDVVTGEIGADNDIRDAEAAPSGPDPKVQAQLDAIAKDYGELSSVSTGQTHTKIRPPEFTLDDMAEKMDTDATKDWERLGMSPGAYFRFRNSGMDLPTWRTRAAGRRGQILLHPFVGFRRAPVSADYTGAIAYDPDSPGTVVEAESMLAPRSSGGVAAGAAVSYGILPYLDVGVVAGVMTGRLTMDIETTTVGDSLTGAAPEERAGKAFFVGPRATLAALPALPVHPTLTADMTFWHATALKSLLLPPSDLPTYDAVTFMAFGFEPGVEARITDHLDFAAGIPLGVVMSGATPQQDHTGSGTLPSAPSPGQVAPLLTGVEAAIQVRFGEPRTNAPTPEDALDDLPEP